MRIAKRREHSSLNRRVGFNHILLNEKDRELRPGTKSATVALLAICRPSGCTVVFGVVGVIVVVVGVCNRFQTRTSKCTCLIFGVSIGLDPG